MDKAITLDLTPLYNFKVIRITVQGVLRNTTSGNIVDYFVTTTDFGASSSYSPVSSQSILSWLSSTNGTDITVDMKGIIAGPVIDLGLKNTIYLYVQGSVQIDSIQLYAEGLI
jgi:hypothetical protein